MGEKGQRPVRRAAHRAIDRMLGAFVPADGATPYRPIQPIEDPEHFFDLEKPLPEVSIEHVHRVRLGGSDVQRRRFAFQSPMRSGVADNDTVRGYWLTPVDLPVRASIVFIHGWKAMALRRLQRVARHATDVGAEVLMPALPHHAWRRPKMTYSGVTMLTPDLDRSLRNMRQAVLDTRSLVAWVQSRAQGPVLLGGVGLGALVAALVATCHEGLDGLALIAAPDRLSELLWSGQGDRGRFREALVSAGLTKADLDETWSVLDPGARPLRLPVERVLLVEGRYDHEQITACTSRLSKRWGGTRCSCHNFAGSDFSLFAGPVVREWLGLVGLQNS